MTKHTENNQQKNETHKSAMKAVPMARISTHIGASRTMFRAGSDFEGDVGVSGAVLGRFWSFRGGFWASGMISVFSGRFFGVLGSFLGVRGSRKSPEHGQT